MRVRALEQAPGRERAVSAEHSAERRAAKSAPFALALSVEESLQVARGEFSAAVAAGFSEFAVIRQ